MSLSFRADFVNCSDALGGDLLQVSFDTLPPDGDEDARRSPHVLISHLFEFPGPATIEWHDGRDYDGGVAIVLITLSRSRAHIRLEQGQHFEITFCLTDEKHIELMSFLRLMLGNRLVACDLVSEAASRENLRHLT